MFKFISFYILFFPLGALSLEINQNLSSRTALELYQTHYISAIVSGTACSESLSKWFDHSGKSKEEILSGRPEAKDLLSPLGLKALSDDEHRDLDQEFTVFMQSTDSSKAGAAKKCGEFTQLIIGTKLRDKLNYSLNQMLHKLMGSIDSLKAKSDLGSRFKNATLIRLQAETKEICEDILNIHSDLKVALKAYIDQCSKKLYGTNPTREQSIKFACDELGKSMCRVAKKAYKNDAN